MAPPPLVIAGAGGVGREALDTALALGIEVAAFLDDRLSGVLIRGVPVQGCERWAGPAYYLIGIADPRARQRLAALLDDHGLEPRTLVHPGAAIAPDTRVESGCLVQWGAFVSSSVTVGRHSQVHYNATIGHDAVLEERVTVYPGANVSGSVHLAAGVTVGSAAVVLQGLEVGAGAFVGAGAVVTHDVGPGAVVVGSPARPIR